MAKKARLRIACAANLVLWGMEKGSGSPSFYNTLSMLAENFDLELFLPQNGADTEIKNDDFSVPVHRVAIPLSIASKLRNWGNGLSGYFGWTVADHLTALGFAQSASAQIIRQHRQQPYDLLYGYEVFGAEAVWQVAKRVPLPSVGRFMGTLLPFRPALKERIRYHFHFRALCHPYSRVIMTDDGTEGDQKLLEWGVPAERIVFWRNGASLPAKDYHKEKPDLDQPVILTASRLVGWKRTERVIHAFARLLASKPEATLQIAGDGPNRAFLEEIVADYGIGARVEFLGALQRDDLFARMAAATVFVSAFDLSNLGNQTFEAMARGLPVVAIGFGSTAQVVQHGISGAVIPVDQADDPDCMAAEIGRLCSSQDHWQSCSVACVEFANLQFWSWEERLQAEVELLRQLVEPFVSNPTP